MPFTVPDNSASNVRLQFHDYAGDAILVGNGKPVEHRSFGEKRTRSHDPVQLPRSGEPRTQKLKPHLR